jgi:uncharacterized protein YprB with RNaseH-like and TPR domain
VRFFSATFGAGVNAAHCPITRPKRRIQAKRYATFALKLVEKYYGTKKYELYTVDEHWLYDLTLYAGW